MEEISTVRQNTYLIIGIILITIFIAGGTYAYISNAVNVRNNVVAGGTTCFNIVYNTGEDITGTLFPSSSPNGGLNGSLSIGISPACSINGVANLYLNVTNGSDILFQSVSPHCENSQTLKTMKDYTSQASCESQPNGKWVTNGTALKYALYDSSDISNSVPINVGHISQTGNIDLYENFDISSAMSNFYVYVWLDGNLSDNTYQNQSFSGNISADAVQTGGNGGNALPTIPETGEAYAIYSGTDDSLRFYRNEDLDTITVGGTYRDRQVTELYTGIETTNYTYDIPPNWLYDDPAKVIVEDEIYPISTARWFSSMTKCTTYDVSKINTSYVTNMSGMFDYSSVIDNNYGESLTLNLSGWNTSSVTDMSYMFSGFGQSALTNINIIGLDTWDTSSVTNMQEMFAGVGLEMATTVNIGNLSGWDTSSVTNMSGMFAGVGYSMATTVNIGNLSGWDTSSVTDMSNMFDSFASSATEINLNLSNWDTSSVETMYYMFAYIGQNAENVSLTLNNWDLSSIQNDMVDYMFLEAGYDATNLTLDLSGWNISSLEHMNNIFENCGYNSTTFNLIGLSDWDTSNVMSMNCTFMYTGYNATNNWIIDLSGWNVDNVMTEASSIFDPNEDRIIPPIWVNGN